jgi:hypothetical protein
MAMEHPGRATISMVTVIPDFLDDDNDGDLVPDMIDVSPNARSGDANTPYTTTRAFGLRLSDVYASRTAPRGALVEIRIPPECQFVVCQPSSI